MLIETPMRPTESYLALGLLGGTFAPIHKGHLLLAQTLIKKLPLSLIQFIPNHTPPHKPKPCIPPLVRADLLEKTLVNFPKFSVNYIEFATQNTKNYTLNTLTKLRHAYPDYALCFILGYDAFAELPTWKNFESLLDYAHLIVTNRGENTLPSSPPTWMKKILNKYRTTDKNALTHKLHGNILYCTVPQSPISSTTVRKKIRAQIPIDQETPLEVAEYFRKQYH